MPDPCARSKLKRKRKRVEKQTPNLADNVKKQEIALVTPMVHSSQRENIISKHDHSTRDEDGDDDWVTQLVGIPLPPRGQSSKQGVYFILEKASLVAAYVGKKYQILNPDKHADYLRRKNINPYDYRPDIVHEALLKIMGSPLRMAGRLRAVFIRTEEGILIRVNPQTHIPEQLGSFCNMMVELLQKFSIKSKCNKGKLLKLIRNPVTQHLPVNSRKISLSFSSPKAVKITDYVDAFDCDEDLVFVVGAMSRGKIDADYTDDLLSVSAYPLCVGTCLRRIHITLEDKWKIHCIILLFILLCMNFY